MVGRTTKLANRVCFHNNLGCTSAIKWSLLNYSTGFPQKVHLTNPHKKKALRREKFSPGRVDKHSPIFIPYRQLMATETFTWPEMSRTSRKWTFHSLLLLVQELDSHTRKHMFFAPDNQQMSNWKTTILAPCEMAPFSGDMVTLRGRGV